VVLRYLETAPQGVAGAVVTSPFIGVAMKAPAWKLALAKLLAGPAPGLGMSAGIDTALLSTDPAVGRAASADPLYHGRMTPAAWREIQAAQLAVVAEADRIAVPLLFLLAGDDRLVARGASEALARSLPLSPEVVVYDGMYHEILNERDQARVLRDLGDWLDRLVPPASPATGATGEA
jgi:alpha-beta hydrolase superfamily lysophospholipase